MKYMFFFKKMKGYWNSYLHGDSDVDTCAINLPVHGYSTSSHQVHIYVVIIFTTFYLCKNFKEKSCHNNYKLQSYFKYHRRLKNRSTL